MLLVDAEVIPRSEVVVRVRMRRWCDCQPELLPWHEVPKC